MLGHGGCQAYCHGGHGWERHTRGGLHPHGCRGGGHHSHGWGFHVRPHGHDWGHFVHPRGHMARGRGVHIHGGLPIHPHGHIAEDWVGRPICGERCIQGPDGGEDHIHGAARSGGRGGFEGEGYWEYGRGRGGFGRGGHRGRHHWHGGRGGPGSGGHDFDVVPNAPPNIIMSFE